MYIHFFLFHLFLSSLRLFFCPPFPIYTYSVCFPFSFFLVQVLCLSVCLSLTFSISYTNVSLCFYCPSLPLSSLSPYDNLYPSSSPCFCLCMMSLSPPASVSIYCHCLAVVGKVTVVKLLRYVTSYFFK
jgi:hypothetical protein